MKQRILRMSIPLFASLCVLTAGIDVQADDTIQLAGNILVVALPAAAAGLTFGVKDGRGALELGESAAISMGMALALKYIVDTTRPSGGDLSFPSGHATISFTSAEFMRKRYGWKYGWPTYALATFVAYSRVEAGLHYPIDVIGGAAIGIVSSYLVTRPYQGWNIQPEVGHSYLGISLNHSW